MNQIEIDLQLEENIKLLLERLSKRRFSIHDEKRLQVELMTSMSALHGVKSEFGLNAKDIIDFFWEGIGVEVKVKGGKKQIYRQLERYASHHSVKAIVLVTSLTMGLPKTIQGKPAYLIKLSQAWL